MRHASEPFEFLSEIDLPEGGAEDRQPARVLERLPAEQSTMRRK